MIISLLRIFAIICVAFVCGKLVSRVRLPAILGWLIAGIVFGPYLAGPVTKTLIPLAAIDDVIGVVVFFTVISFVSGTGGQASSPIAIIAMTLFPFVIGIQTGWCAAFLIKRIASVRIRLCVLILFLCISAVCGLLIDRYVFGAFSLNYLLIGMAFSATVANLIPEDQLEQMMQLYDPLLNVSLVIVIVNLGMPLDYRLIAGAGLFTAIYILSRAAGKIGGAYLGGRLTKAEPVVVKYLGLTLLPHSGVSLVFTGIAVSTLDGIDPSLASIVSGTIVAAAIINEIIAVIVAKFAFKWAGEIGTEESSSRQIHTKGKHGVMSTKHYKHEQGQSYT